MVFVHFLHLKRCGLREAGVQSLAAVQVQCQASLISHVLSSCTFAGSALHLPPLALYLKSLGDKFPTQASVHTGRFLLNFGKVFTLPTTSRSRQQKQQPGFSFCVPCSVSMDQMSDSRSHGGHLPAPGLGPSRSFSLQLQAAFCSTPRKASAWHVDTELTLGVRESQASLLVSCPQTGFLTKY